MGSIKDLAVFLDPEPTSALAYRLGMRLAQRWQAHLMAVFSAPVISCNPWLRGESIGHAVDEYLGVIGAAERRIRSDFENTCQQNGIAWEWQSQNVELARDLVIHARYAALSIVARSDLVGAPLMDLPEQLILGSGRPTLLLPATTDPDFPLGRCVAVGWNASPEAARAVWDAMPLLIAAEKVCVLVVDQDQNDNDDREGRQGEDLVRHLEHYGVKAELRLLRSDGGDVSTVFRDVTKEISADLQVLGAYSRPRVSEVLFGGVTRWALREARIPTLLSR
jgi:nucleotide-binding universal stress UspA family protein